MSLPFVLASGQPLLACLDKDGALAGFDISRHEIKPIAPHHVDAFISIDPAAVFYGVRTERAGAQRLAAEKRAGKLAPKGHRFSPIPSPLFGGAPILTGFEDVRETLLMHRRELPTIETIRLSAVFAGSSIMTSIEQAEKSFGCIAHLYKREGEFPSVEDARDCLYSAGLFKMRASMYREVEAWSPKVQAAMARGLRDRELRRHLILETELPTGLSLAKVSFVLALLGQDCVCLDARILNRMGIEEQAKRWSHVSKLSLARYEAAEDSFLSGNVFYRRDDPIGRARAQWMSWESVGGAPAKHSVWLDVMKEKKPRLRALEEGPMEKVSLDKFAEAFLGTAELGKEGYWQNEDMMKGDARVPRLVKALKGITKHERDVEILGAGSFGTAAALSGTHVVKLTTDPSEVQAGAVLIAKRLSHVTRVYASYFTKDVFVRVAIAWDAFKDEEIYSNERAGVLLVERVTPLDKSQRVQLSRLVNEFKQDHQLYPSQLMSLPAKEQRNRLQWASGELERQLRNSSGDRTIFNGVADALRELREVGIFAIDVHGGNVGLDAAGVVKVFDIGSSSPPAKPKAKVFGAGEGMCPEGVRAPVWGDAGAEEALGLLQWRTLPNGLVIARGRKGDYTITGGVTGYKLYYSPSHSDEPPKLIGSFVQPIDALTRAKQVADWHNDHNGELPAWMSREGGTVMESGGRLPSMSHDFGDHHGYYIVDIITHTGAVDGPYWRVDDADDALKAKYSHRTHQVIDGRYLNDAAFVSIRRSPPRGGVGPKSAREDYAHEQSVKAVTIGEEMAMDFPTEDDARGAAVKQGATHVGWDAPDGADSKNYFSHAVYYRPSQFLRADPDVQGWDKASVFFSHNKYHLTPWERFGAKLPDDAGPVRKSKLREGASERAPVVYEAAGEHHNWDGHTWVVFINPKRGDTHGPTTRHEMRFDKMTHRSDQAWVNAQAAAKFKVSVSRVLSIPAYASMKSSEARDAGPYATMARPVGEAEAGRALGAIREPRDLYELLRPSLAQEVQEVFVVVPVTVHGEPCCPPVEVARGQRDRVSVDHSDVLRPVIATNAVGYYVAHCHPSGHASPSEADLDLTKSIETSTKKALPNVVFLDHMIVTSNEFYSIKAGKLFKA